jgi:hypothetical protein
MEETLITFETAKLAKEKGFNVGVNQSYIIYKESYNYDDDPNHRESYKVNDIEINSHYHVNNHKGIDLSNELYEAYSAPTQSLLQRWLRDVHKIHVDIKEWELIYWYFYIKDGRTSPVKDIRIKIDEDSKWEFDSYEEALEVGLLEGLKLVKDELV